MKIIIQNPEGSVRKGTDPYGTKWAVKMPCAYGYIEGVLGLDGEDLDVLLYAPIREIIAPGRRPVFVMYIKTVCGTKLDEEKVFLNFPSREHALDAFRKVYPDIHNKIENEMHTMTLSTLKMNLPSAAKGITTSNCVLPNRLPQALPNLTVVHSIPVLAPMPVTDFCAAVDADFAASSSRWKELEHPRGGNGRFATKSSPKEEPEHLGELITLGAGKVKKGKNRGGFKHLHESVTDLYHNPHPDPKAQAAASKMGAVLKEARQDLKAAKIGTEAHKSAWIRSLALGRLASVAHAKNGEGLPSPRYHVEEDPAGSLITYQGVEYKKLDWNHIPKDWADKFYNDCVINKEKNLALSPAVHNVYIPVNMEDTPNLWVGTSASHNSKALSVVSGKGSEYHSASGEEKYSNIAKAFDSVGSIQTKIREDVSKGVPGAEAVELLYRTGVRSQAAKSDSTIGATNATGEYLTANKDGTLTLVFPGKGSDRIGAGSGKQEANRRILTSNSAMSMPVLMQESNELSEEREKYERSGKTLPASFIKRATEHRALVEKVLRKNICYLPKKSFDKIAAKAGTDELLVPGGYETALAYAKTIWDAHDIAPKKQLHAFRHLFGHMATNALVPADYAKHGMADTLIGAVARLHGNSTTDKTSQGEMKDKQSEKKISGVPSTHQSDALRELYGSPDASESELNKMAKKNPSMGMLHTLAHSISDSPGAFMESYADPRVFDKMFKHYGIEGLRRAAPAEAGTMSKLIEENN